jgi:hypothetical protein
MSFKRVRLRPMTTNVDTGRRLGSPVVHKAGVELQDLPCRRTCEQDPMFHRRGNCFW